MSERELQDATYFFMEFVEHCDRSDVLMLIELCQQYADITMWTKPDMADIRQNTVYGIGVMSKYISAAAFKSLLPKSLQAIEVCLSNPEAQTEENLAVTENALITLGYISLMHSKDQAQVAKFVSALPLTGEEEAQEAHTLLFKQMLAKNFCGCQDQMTKAVLAIKEAHAANDQLLTQEGVQLLNQVLTM